jgi:endogenous inhibitor of DNA gyrase (YacG/DUF329 family)
MRCPICQKPVQMSDPFMPFCSERCKLLDLGNWASEKYVISEPVRLSDVEDVESDDPE